MGINSTNESGKPNNQKQKSHSRKLLRRNLSSNRPSCKNDAAKIHINRETAIVNLEKLEKSYQQNNKIRGFLICIKSALGLKPTQGASGYGIVSIPQNALALIIRSIIGFLETGVYEDLTGVAVVHRSP